MKNLKIKGSFHYEKGYYYFRNIDNRILLGGGEIWIWMLRKQPNLE